MKEQLVACSDDTLMHVLCSDPQVEMDRNIAKHIESCKHCQKRIEELAGSAAQWKMAKAHLSSFDSLDYSEAESRYLSGECDVERAHRDQSWMEAFTRQWLQPPSHPELLGRLGRFDIERWIGSGGMGVVYKAFDTELNRPVAIKILAPYLAGIGAARQRFGREAKAAAAIVHEHVVAIHNVESNHESPYLVMQYVAGESLQQRLDRVGSLELCEILRIAKQTAAGLAAAHSQGLVHRDVKPSNILLEEGIERALLTDFGLARAADDASLTHTGYHPGTPEFMSPEQARGESVDARSDLFSLGSVLYTMCTGRTPFRAESSYGVLRKITDAEPVAIRELNPSIPDWLEAFIKKLHAKEANQRWTSAREVHELLEGCLAHVQNPTSVDLPELLRVNRKSVWQLWRNAKTKAPNQKNFGERWQTVLTLGGSLLVALGIVGVIWQFERGEKVVPSIDEKLATAEAYGTEADKSNTADSIAVSTPADSSPSEALKPELLDWNWGNETLQEIEANANKMGEGEDPWGGEK